MFQNDVSHVAVQTEIGEGMADRYNIPDVKNN
jgi:hypothetical protein